MITKKTKMFAVFSLVFFVGSVAGTFFVWQYVDSQGEELLGQAKEIADFQAREQTYRDLENLVIRTQEERDELETYLLTEGETIGFLSTIEQIAVEQGVELTTNSLHVEEGTAFFDTLIISYSIEGLKERVDSVLLILESLPYHAHVSSVSFNYKNSEGQDLVEGSIELTVSLLSYDR